MFEASLFQGLGAMTERVPSSIQKKERGARRLEDRDDGQSKRGHFNMVVEGEQVKERRTVKKFKYNE